MRITTSFGPLTWTRVTEPSRLTPFPSTRRFMTGPEMTVQVCGLWSGPIALVYADRGAVPRPEPRVEGGAAPLHAGPLRVAADLLGVNEGGAAIPPDPAGEYLSTVCCTVFIMYCIHYATQYAE